MIINKEKGWVPLIMATYFNIHPFPYLFDIYQIAEGKL